MISIDKNDFKNALTIAQKALPVIVVQEERAHILVRVRGNKVLVSATNNDFKSLSTIDLEDPSDSDFSFTVEPKSVLKLLNKIKVDNIRIEVDKEKYIAKYYTSDNDESFSESQSFSEDVMLTFDETLIKPKHEIIINKDILKNGLKYAKEYLEDLKVDKARYDFVIINKGLIYSANGSNKMGFLVNREFKDFSNFKIRKIFVPVLLRVIDLIKNSDCGNVSVFETERDIGIKTIDDSIVFSSLKSDIEAPEVKREYANTNGPYCLIDRKEFINNLDRLVALEKTPRSSGIRLTVKNSGEEASIEMELVSSLKSKEVLPCKRVQEDSEEIEHIVDSKIIKGIISSFSSDRIRLYINDSSKMYKVYEKGDINGSEFHAFAIGAYSRVTRS